MLELLFKAVEGWDQKKEEFVLIDEKIIKMEHSLYSISKWESKWKKSFISGKEKTQEEIFDYFKCMLLEPIDDIYFDLMSSDNIKTILDYINDPYTATTINQTEGNRPSREIITAEIVYYWMVALQIPFECQYWNFNKLMTLIQVCNIKNQPPKKMSRSQALAQNKSLNAARRAARHSKG